MESMEKIEEFMRFAGINEEEALMALLSAFSPPNPATTRQAWIRSAEYGNSVPEAKVFLSLLVKSDYKCVKCGSRLKLTFDHIDSVPDNHDIDNLQVLCFSCNRGKSSRPTKYKRKKALVYNAFMHAVRTNGKSPTNREVCELAAIDQLGGEHYFTKWLRFVVDKWNQS